MNKKKLSGVIIGILGITMMTYAVLGSADAHFKECHKDCEILPSITITPSVTPTDEPIATPSATPTLTPNQGGTSDNRSDRLSSSPDATKPFVASCIIPFNAPLLQGFAVEGNGSVTFSWWGVPNVDKYSIIYGYSPESLIYGEDGIPSSSTSITLNGLEVGRNVYAVVGAWRNGCVENSNVLDPIVK